jgi:3'-5' exoribonuclease
MSESQKQGIDDNLRDDIGHMILSHHGRLEWNSPVEPQTVEAQILHFADYLNAFYAKKN